MTAVIAYDNTIMSSTLTAGSALASMPVENIQNDVGAASVGWQTEAGVVTAADGATITITPSSTGLTWRAFGLYRTNLMPSATITFALYTNPATLVWSETVDGPVAGYGQVTAIADADQTADYCVISIDDPSNLDGWINVPLAFAGPAWVPIGPSWQTRFGREDMTDENVSKGGQEYPVPRFQRRVWDVDMQAIEQADIWTQANELDRLSREGENILFVPDIASDNIAYEAIYGRLKPTTHFGFLSPHAGIYVWHFMIRERI